MMARSTVSGEHGNRLMKVMLKAANLEARRVTKLVCTMERNAFIMFDATIMAEEEDISKALEQSCPLAHPSPALAEESSAIGSAIGVAQAGGATSSEGPARSEDTTTNGNSSDPTT